MSTVTVGILGFLAMVGLMLVGMPIAAVMLLLGLTGGMMAYGLRNFRNFWVRSMLSWQPWQVSGLTFSAGMIVRLWEKFPLAKAEFIGNDLRFWLYLHRWSLDLLARGKFLAGINQGQSCWYPLLDSTIDRTRLAKFIQTIPPVCLAYQENSEPQTIILDCLKNIVDARLRQKIDSTVNISPSLMVKPWLQSLSSDHHDIALEAKNLQRLENAYNNWVFPIQESLVNGNNRQLIENQYRVCLCLQPPSLGTAWKLTYYLQALDDPEFLISAKLIWLEGKESYHSYQRVVNNPQEILLIPPTAGLPPYKHTSYG